MKVIAYDTKGGQQSIFNDGIMGAFHIKLWRDPKPFELKYLQSKYANLGPEKLEDLLQKLSFINIGEMQPQYIMRYGFYEGHTYWRADPVAIAFIFGLVNLEELDPLFGHQLDKVMLTHHTTLSL